MSTKSRRNADKPRLFKATEPGPLADLPLAILINGNSASASEVVAAALQDYRRVLLLGEESFGKWTVQNLIRLGGEASGGVLKLTTSSFHPPESRSVRRDENGNRLGLTPDVPVQTDAETARALRSDWHGESFSRLNEPYRIDRQPKPSFDPATSDVDDQKPIEDPCVIRAVALLTDLDEYRGRLLSPPLDANGEERADAPDGDPQSAKSEAREP